MSHKDIKQSLAGQAFKNKALIVGCLVSCLTNFQLSTPAWADESLRKNQVPASEKSTQSSSLQTNGEPQVLPTGLATPSLILAPQSGFQVKTSYIHTEEDLQLKNVDGNYTSSADAGELRLAYGLKPSFYFGTGVGYQMKKGKADMAVFNQGSVQRTNNEGVSDPKLFIGSRLNFGRISIVGNFDTDISTGSSEVKRKQNQVTETNNKAGGSMYTPSLSLFTNDPSSMLMGSAMSYQFRQSRKVSLKDFSGYQAEGRATGGNRFDLSVFVETPTVTHSLGGLVNWSKGESEKTISPDGSEVVAAGKEQLTGSLYGNIKIFKNISIIPVASYYYFMNGKSGDDDLRSQSIYSGALNLQANF